MADRRQSKKRNAILELIRASRAHPGAQWVYERLKPRFPDLSLGTVYRNIKILTEEGALVSAGVINGEERFDGISAPHSHAVCSCCGLVMDLPDKAEDEIFANRSVTISGFAIDLRKTVFYGLCMRCKPEGCGSAGCKETTALGR